MTQRSSMQQSTACSRRGFLTAAAAAAGAWYAAPFANSTRADQPASDAAGDAKVLSGKALISITLDLEMSRNFPVWEEMRWDYEKGNLNEETKRYTVEACRRVKAQGGLLHTFAVGRVFEQQQVDWLKQIVADGHPVGNHTYDHVNVCATRPEDIQFRFQRAPWLIEGKTPAEVIRENIRLASIAIETHLGKRPAGFRTPGGFPTGLSERPDVRQMIRELGFPWVSSQYPRHITGEPMREPGAEVYEAIVAAQQQAQPFAYPDGLVEVPMSPTSDVTVFRTPKWRLEWFLEAIRRGVGWAIEHRATYDFLAHPSCLYVVDPQFRALDLICDLVRQAGPRAQIVPLDALAARARQATG